MELAQRLTTSVVIVFKTQIWLTLYSPPSLDNGCIWYETGQAPSRQKNQGCLGVGLREPDQRRVFPDLEYSLEGSKDHESPPKARSVGSESPLK